MKRILKSFSHKLLLVYRIEFIVLLVVVALLLGGSLYAALRAPESSPIITFGGGGDAVSRRPVTGNGGSGEDNGGLSVFNGIGRLRISVAGQSTGATATMVISVAFPYPGGDRPFTEELASKIADFRTITTDYFSSLPASSITYLNEETAKADLLRRYNAILSLGRIEALYFSDLMIIEADSDLQ